VKTSLIGRGETLCESPQRLAAAIPRREGKALAGLGKSVENPRQSKIILKLSWIFVKKIFNDLFIRRASVPS
jgi:hypothetical protein